MKFSSGLGRKNYTYSQSGQIMEITNGNKLKKKTNQQISSKISTLIPKSQDDENKSKDICITFAKKQIKS